ncbi:HNH endonuclease [Rhizobium leguminosarum]
MRDHRTADRQWRRQVRRAGCTHMPVDEGGPDVVQNGIALSATVHWLFG